MNEKNPDAALAGREYPIARGGIPDRRFCVHWWRGLQCRLAPEHAGAHDYSRPVVAAANTVSGALRPSTGRTDYKRAVCPRCKKVFRHESGLAGHQRFAYCVKF
jgi:hypothetical protein